MTSVAPPPAEHPPRDARRRGRAADRARDGAAARGAVLAAAAALGALVGLGIRSGASLGRLGVVTLRLRGLPEFVAPDRGATGAALLGGLHVAVVAGLWGAAAAGVAAGLRRRRAEGGRSTAALLAASLAALGLALLGVDALVPSPLRLAAGALTRAERALVGALVMACGAAAGWVGQRREGPRPRSVTPSTAGESSP